MSNCSVRLSIVLHRCLVSILCALKLGWLRVPTSLMTRRISLSFRASRKLSVHTLLFGVPLPAVGRHLLSQIALSPVRCDVDPGHR